MLASLLLISSPVRANLLAWLGELAKCPFPFWDDDEVTCQILTEQPIGAKRDDLRIEAWRSTDKGETLVALWSVEVKVGSSLHSSSRQELGGESDEEAGLDNVIQVKNYDHWLQLRRNANPHAHVAGFVLALTDISEQLPKDLASPWPCITWTQLGANLKKCLETQQLIEADAFLTRHTLGFIRKYLWRDDDMKTSDSSITFDDVALLRAYRMIASDCERRVNCLVEPLLPILDAFLNGSGQSKHQKQLYGPYARSDVYALLFPPHPYPYICAGIGGPSDRPAVTVWLETAPNSKYTSVVCKVVDEHLSALNKLDSRWRKGDSDSWWRLTIEWPLEELLAEENQESAISSFVAKSLNQLKESNMFTALKKAVDKESL